MRSRFTLGSAVALLLLNACISVDHKTKTEGDGGSTGSGGTSGTGSKAGTGSKPGSGGSGAGGAGGKATGGSTGKGGTGGKGGATGADGGPVSAVPTLKSIDAHVTGRAGEGVTLTVEGEDADKDVLLLYVAWKDSKDEPIVAFDTDWDGVPDATDARLFFDKDLRGEDTFTGTITMPDFFLKHPDAATVTVHLEDQAGQSSDDATAELAEQALRKKNEVCDPAIVEDRCESGLACVGAAPDDPKCADPGPPAISEIAYLRNTEGPQLLVAGTDPADDIANLRLEFLTKTNVPVQVDLNGDLTPDSSTFDLGVIGSSQYGSFFVRDILGVAFDKSVPRIAVTPSDARAHSGERRVIDATDPPTRAAGQSCDPRGFNRCAGDTACSPGVVGASNTCVAAGKLRTDNCAAAPELDPDKGALSAFGRAQGGSLYDPPAGCAPVFAVGRPEGVVRLRLAGGATKLTVTTSAPETRFDTVLYVLPACDAKSTAALGCNDDTDGFSSTVTLADVPSGDYLIVVDSAKDEGGGFGVSVTVE